MFDRGSGPALVVIPGLQGRWEWMADTLDALSAYARVISYSLGPARTFEDLLVQLDEVLSARRLTRAVLCGVSFGGRIAAAHTATRPASTQGLVLVSTPGPSFAPSAAQQAYLTRPWLLTPAFLVSSPFRMWPEIAAAIPGAAARLRFALTYLWRLASNPIVPATMATRMQMKTGLDLADACRRVAAPALVVSGEPHLDRIVPVDSTREFAALIPGAKYEMMKGTGHLGLVTQPETFARIVGTFVNAASS